MRVRLQFVICDDDGQEETVIDVVTLKKDHRRIEHLGWTLAEAKHLLIMASGIGAVGRLSEYHQRFLPPHPLAEL